MHEGYNAHPPFAEPLTLPMLCLLGTPALMTSGSMLPVRIRPKGLAVLAMLALGREPVTRAELAQMLFAEAADPRAALRWHLNHLRSALPPEIAEELVTEGDFVRLTCDVDALVFSSEARRVEDEPWRPDASRVLALYRGDFCATLAISASPSFDGWLYAEQEKLRRQYRLACTKYAGWAIEQGVPEHAVESLFRLVAVEPFFEEAHLLLVRCLELSGRRQQAKEAYKRYERVLREDLNASPDPELAAKYSRGKKRTGMRLPAERFVNLDQVTLHIVEWPGGEPSVVAIPGSGNGAYSLAALGQRLAPEFRFIAVDLRGFGFSDKPAGSYSIEVLAQDIVELLGVLEIPDAVMVGFSIGGAVATHVAMRCRPRGLILLDGVVGPTAFTHNAAAQIVDAVGSSFEMTFGGFDQYLRQWRRSGSPEYSSEAERLLEAMVRFDLAPVGGGRVRRRGLRAALEETWESAAAIDTLQALTAVWCPVLIVHATQPWIEGRPYLDDEIVREQLQAARNSTLLIAENSNHPRLVRDPELSTIQGIKSFFRGLTPGPST